MSYAVPDDVLTPYLAPGLELDRRDGSAWCSLVAFNFEQARGAGVERPLPPLAVRFPRV